MRRAFLPAAVLLVSITGWAPLYSQAEENGATAKKADAFFAGSVVATTSEKLTVSRTVLGKNETRSFAVTSETKVKGRLSARARVTVRYTADDTGDTAVLIVVRGAAPPRPPAAKKK